MENNGDKLSIIISLLICGVGVWFLFSLPSWLYEEFKPNFNGEFEEGELITLQCYDVKDFKESQNENGATWDVIGTESNFVYPTDCLLEKKRL